MKTIGQLIKVKGNEVWSIEPDASVFDALRLMAEKNIGALLVISGEQVVGVLSERDYARKVILVGRSSKETLVRDIMSYRVIFARTDETIEDCLAVMTKNHVRHLPVFDDDDQLVGVVSIGDLVNAIINTQKHLIQKLENYIIQNQSIT